MPRTPRPWYRVERMEYYGKVEGKDVPLGIKGEDTPENRAAALVAHQKLIQEAARQIAQATLSGLNSPPPARASPTASNAVAGFLAKAAKRLARGQLVPKTLALYRTALSHFTAAFGPRSLADLATEAGCEEIEDWAALPRSSRGDPAKLRPWSPSTQNDYLGTVLALFKWAGLRLAVRRPPKESRGAAACLTDEQFARLVAYLSRPARGGQGDLAALLTALRETGARPQEVAPLLAEDVDWDAGQVRRSEHKTRRHTGTLRVIYLSAAALAVFRAQREKYGSGLLFRTKAGKAYRPAAIVRRMLAASRVLGFRAIAYGQRHAFATTALVSGVSEAVLAALLGHVGTGMVARNYGHVGSQAKILREAAERVSRRKEAG